jgi:hypothetical protein
MLNIAWYILNLAILCNTLEKILIQNFLTESFQQLSLIPYTVEMA